MPQSLRLTNVSRRRFPSYDHQVRYNFWNYQIYLPLQEQDSASTEFTPEWVFCTSVMQNLPYSYLHHRLDERAKPATYLSSHPLTQRCPHILSRNFLPEQISVPPFLYEENASSIIILFTKLERKSYWKTVTNISCIVLVCNIAVSTNSASAELSFSGTSIGER